MLKELTSCEHLLTTAILGLLCLAESSRLPMVPGHGRLRVLVLFVSHSSRSPSRHIKFSLVQRCVLFLENVQKSLGGLEYLHKRLFSFRYGSVKLFPCFILSYQSVRELRKSFRKVGNLIFYSLLLLFIFADLLMQLIPSGPDVLDIPSELAVVSL